MTDEKKLKFPKSEDFLDIECEMIEIKGLGGGKWKTRALGIGKLSNYYSHQNKKK